MSAETFSYDVATPSRGDGFSALVHAAYISGQTLFDQTENRTQSLGSAERVVHTEISVPESSPQWVREVAEGQDRERLWNRAEAAEKHPKAQVCRRIILAIDDGLFASASGNEQDRAASVEMQAGLVREHVRRSFASQGMIADWAIHWDKEHRNPHAHIILTRRMATEEGFSKWKDGQTKPASREQPPERPWNDRKAAERWRTDWAQIQNQELERLDLPYRIDNRSYQRRGLDLQAGEKHFGREEKQAANVLRAERQAERLVGNPRPLFDAMSQSYVNTLSERDLAVYAERFGRAANREKEILGAIKASPELVRLGGGMYTTQGILAKRAKAALEPVLAEIGRVGSWKELDRRLAGAGWRMEAVHRQGRVVHDLVSVDDPGRRVSAFRVDERLGPQATQAVFGTSRVKHELGDLARQKKVYFAALRDEVWKEHKQGTFLEREEFQRRHGEFMKKRGRQGGFALGSWVAWRAGNWLWTRRRRRLAERQAVREDIARRRMELLRRREEWAIQQGVEERKAELFPGGQEPGRRAASPHSRSEERPGERGPQRPDPGRDNAPAPEDSPSARQARELARLAKAMEEFRRGEDELTRLAVRLESDPKLLAQSRRLAASMAQSPLWRTFRESLAKEDLRQVDRQIAARQRERDRGRERE